MNTPCQKCKGDTHDTWYGDWCDNCGGVMARPDLLLFRHVATVDGKEGRFAIVYDCTTVNYKFIHPNKSNPNAGRPGIDGDFTRPALLTSWGPLDALLGIAQAAAQGSDPEPPELSVAPSATEEERALMGI